MTNLIDEINRSVRRDVKAAVFDIGGVLVQINRRWEDALKDAGIRSSAFGDLENAPHLLEFQRGEIQLAEYLDALRDFLHVTSPEEALHVHNMILKDPYPGTLDLVQELNELGIVTACLSNTNSPHWALMTQSGRYPNIEALQRHAVSQELGLQKPDTAIYRAFEDMSGLMPGEILYFDDAEINVEGALEAGWRAFWIDHSADTAEQMELLLIAEGAMPAP